MQRSASPSVLVLLLVASALTSCARSDDESPPDYKELAVVLKARLGSCLSNQGFQPTWPTTDWSPKHGIYDYAHPVPINNLSLVSDGTEYRLYFANRAAVVYMVATAGLSGQSKTYGPLSLAVRCPT